MATLICMRTVFSAVPQSLFIVRCSLSQLKFCQQSFLIEICDILCRKMLCIRKESEFTTIFFVIVAYESERVCEESHDYSVARLSLQAIGSSK